MRIRGCLKVKVVRDKLARFLSMHLTEVMADSKVLLLWSQWGKVIDLVCRSLNTTIVKTTATNQIIITMFSAAAKCSLIYSLLKGTDNKPKNKTKWILMKTKKNSSMINTKFFLSHKKVFFKEINRKWTMRKNMISIIKQRAVGYLLGVDHWNMPHSWFIEQIRMTNILIQKSINAKIQISSSARKFEVAQTSKLIHESSFYTLGFPK